MTARPSRTEWPRRAARDHSCRTIASAIASAIVIAIVVAIVLASVIAIVIVIVPPRPVPSRPA